MCEFYPELLRAVISLKHSLSEIYGIDASQIHPNYGSNGSIDTVLTAVKTEESKKLAQWAQIATDYLEGRSPRDSAESGCLAKEVLTKKPRLDGAMFTSPTYFRNYNSATAKGLSVRLVPLKPNFEFDGPVFVDAMIQHQPSIVFLVTPNNPTGLPISDEDLCSVLDALPSGSWALIDRTLVNTRPEISTRELLQRYRSQNVLILHYFSKYKGMSHLRIGVALYSNSQMAKVVQPHLPLGIALEGCVKANRIILTEGGIVPSADVLANIKENHAILREFTTKFPEFPFTDFAGNYCLLMLPKPYTATQVSAVLQQTGIYVMPGHEFPEETDSAIRLHTGGPPQYMRRFCSAMEAITAAKPHLPS